jgi:TolB-like protein/Tfp pilus assembly protein PilF
MPLSSGTHLGTYHITGLLGAGAMGEVYRARDTRLKRDVAIKVLPASVAGDPDRLVRFEREARTIAGLNHPNIVTLFSVEDEGDVRFLTMELVEGQSLDRVVTPGGLPLARVLELSIPLANALVAAHERGVIHRDLKPANVMVTREGRLKVLDFGLARHAGLEPVVGPGDAGARTIDSPISSPGSVVGTVPYMAPEQVRGEPVDARADLFSFGILLYEMVAGRRPFAGQSWADVSSSILRDAPPPLVHLRGDLPRDLERIVARCLEKDRERRFQTAKDVRNELDLVRREADSSGAAAATAAGTPAAAAPAAAPAGGGPSVAVLPFANRSASDEDEYFSDGLADELLNVLARIRGLRVAARTSSATFKGKAVPIAEVGEALKVATVLEGSVRRAGNRVRIAVQLVQVSDGYPLWSETYDRTLDDIFAVQDDIAQSVVKELRARLLGDAPDSETSREVRAEVAAAGAGRGTHPESHRLTLQARHLIDRLNEKDTLRAIEYLERAIALDPDNALALVALADARANQGGYGWLSVDEGFGKAREAALAALALAPELPEAHIAHGRVLAFHDYDWKAARDCAERALALSPDHPEGLRLAGRLLPDAADLPRAIELLERSTEIDPLGSSAFATLGLLLRAAGRLEDALAAFHKALELSPQRIGSHLMTALTLRDMGRLEDAFAEVEQEPARWAKITGLAVLHHDAGREAEARSFLEELVRDNSVDSGYQIAAVYAVFGEADAMFAWFDRAIEESDGGVMIAPIEPFLRPYHADPRWARIRRALKLDPA